MVGLGGMNSPRVFVIGCSSIGANAAGSVRGRSALGSICLQCSHEQEQSDDDAGHILPPLCSIVGRPTERMIDLLLRSALRGGNRLFPCSLRPPMTKLEPGLHRRILDQRWCVFCDYLGGDLRAHILSLKTSHWAIEPLACVITHLLPLQLFIGNRRVTCRGTPALCQASERSQGRETILRHLTLATGEGRVARARCKLRHN